MSDNGEQNEGIGGTKQKWCPHLNEYCIGDRCALYSHLMRVQEGIPQSVGLCAYNATVMMLSEINQKTQGPQKTPKLYQPWEK